MNYISTFERVEKKYLLNTLQIQRILPAICEFMQADEYGLSTISSLYLDTPDDLLVRRSIAKPDYKEKLRLRSYGRTDDDSTVYLEIKKKVSGVVYKRRIALTATEAMAYLQNGEPPKQRGQILSEIDHMMKRYALTPKVYLAYDRTAYFEREPSPDMLRVTIDQHIRSRESDLDLRRGDAGKLLLPEGTYLMEIKTAYAIPLWLSSTLSKSRVYPISFSKYGRVYQERMLGAEAAMAHPGRFLDNTRHSHAYANQL